MRYSRVIRIKHAWRAGELLACQSTSCLRAVMPRRARTNRAIAKIEGRVKEEARKTAAVRIQVPSGLICRGASRIERSYRVPRRRGRPVLSGISWPSSRGHSSRSNFPDVSLSRGRDWTRRRVVEKGEVGEERSPVFPSLLQMSRAEPVPSRFCGCSRNTSLFLRRINSRWRAAKCERRSCDNKCSRFCTLRHRKLCRRSRSRRSIVHHRRSTSTRFFRFEAHVRNSSYEITLAHNTSLPIPVFISILFFVKN